MERRTYLVIDGENLDATLGNQVLNRRPAPEDRPRWDRVLGFAGRAFGHPVTGLFFLNASSGTPPMPFVQALQAIGMRPVLLAGPADVKVVDVGIQRTLDAIAERDDADVILGSHDGDFAPQLERLLGDEARQVAALGFKEFTSGALHGLVERGLQIYDLEDDAGAFTRPLPRLRIVHIDDFDPASLL